MQSEDRTLDKRWLVSRVSEGKNVPMDSFATEQDAKLYAVLAIHGIWPGGYVIEDTEKAGR